MPERPPNSDIYPKNGGYEKLVSHQMAELLEDITKRFVARYVDRWSRTTDQMVQASRSGARNIAEGSLFSATSKKIEMNLTNVARASITELKRDYAAFLRQNKLTLWPMSDAIRQELIDSRLKLVDDVARWGASVHKREPSRSLAEISANIGHVYCMVAGGLLDRQMQSQARDFEANGGFNERLYRIRSEAKKKGNGPKPDQA
ncbi:MAG: four helix bundle protein [Flavobacteriales bacterium]|nr:four helix bundle protein [Flavobacteriales bacterium]MBK6892678.1 four helix bundle protein [Flavobacteriales bacterium]MBK7246819.1 four helix bundle protein [Flavobacteriales bacterium]HQX31724.1 four helix bundle suffix domain-containing protein [Flavobacteriales bacterium]